MSDLLEAVRSLGLYLRNYDYKTSMRDSATWEAFIEAIEAFSHTDVARNVPGPTLADATTCARWFYHMMMPLSVRIGRASVFHATSASPCALPGVIARQIEGTRLVVTEHGVYLRERYISISSSYFTQVQKRFLVGLATMIGRVCYAAADVIAPVAAFNTRWEVPWGASPERIRVIYNGVDTRRFLPGPKPKTQRARPTVVVAARVFPLKDIETMIRATDVTRRKVPNVRVLVYGSLKADAVYVERCRKLVADLDLSKNFDFRGFHPTPSQLFLEGDISALSSISEGFPYTIIESMSCGVPCVATDVGGVREAVADTGLVVPPRNPQALGHAIADLLQQHDKRRRLARLARERVIAEFTIQKQLESYKALYLEMHAVDSGTEHAVQGAA